ERVPRPEAREQLARQMCGACSDEGVKFYFKDGFRAQTDRSYQVTRADFDKVMLDHASENGAEVHEETSVERVTFSDDGVELFVSKNGSSRNVRARYVVDASGRNS